MSIYQAIVKQRVMQAGMQNHKLLQVMHDQLKANYMRKQVSRNSSLGLKAGGNRFFGTFSIAQLTPRLAVNSALILSFGGLQVADGIVTYLGLSFAELTEVNPVLNYFSSLLGLGFSIGLLKLVILGVIAAVFLARRTIRGHWATAALALAVMFYCGVVASNVRLVVGW